STGAATNATMQRSVIGRARIGEISGYRKVLTLSPNAWVVARYECIFQGAEFMPLLTVRIEELPRGIDGQSDGLHEDR
ncbi:MAG TPA: hypothetical protein VGI57_10310, partial [Usitatibacter sp.]